MIIYFRNGRLGNQLFQYSFLKKISKKNEKIILVGFSELKENFYTKNVIYLFSNRFLKKLMFPNFDKYNLDRIFSFFSLRVIPNLYLFKIIEFDEDNNNYKILNKISIFKNIYFVKNFFAQTDKYIDKKKIDELKFKVKTIEKSKRIIKNLQAKNQKIFFVHIRQGDYKKINHNMNINLPIEWYRKCIRIIEKKYINPYFIILSDDNEIYRKFNDKNKYYCSKNNFLIDFCIMSLCDGGILSASSFSWWGAHFAKNKKNDTYFIAPNFWMGFSKKIWFPKNIKSNYFKYLDV